MTARPNMWFKSSKSGPNCDNCVEVNFGGVVAGMAAVRDTKDRQGSVLVVDVASVATVGRAAAAGRLVAV